MGPDDIASTSEHSHQAALLSCCPLLTEVAPELTWLFAIPNGGDRNLVTAGNLKAEGVKPGVADLLLPVARRGWHGFFVEMKKPGHKHQQSAKQKEFEQFVQSQGYLYAVFDHWAEALRALLWYLEIPLTSIPEPLQHSLN